MRINKNLQPFLIVLAAAIAIGAVWAVQTIPTREKIPWRLDYAAGIAEARRANKPVLLDFSATWCGPCQQMNRTTWTDDGVAAALAGYVPIHIDVDEHKDLASQYHVVYIPMMVVQDSSGAVKQSTYGGYDPAQFLTWLKTGKAAKSVVIQAADRNQASKRKRDNSELTL